MKTHLEKCYSFSKYEAKTKNIEFGLTFEEFVYVRENPCYYCENKLHSKTVYGVGLDRIDSSKGYTIDNVLPCCYLCNRIKSNILTSNEMKEVASLLITLRINSPKQLTDLPKYLNIPDKQLKLCI